MENTVFTDSRVVVVKSLISRKLDGEVAILNPKSEMLYSLDAVGSRIWDLLQEPLTVAEIRDAILEEYEVDAHQCERNLLEFLQKLATEGLIEVQDETAS